MAAADISLFTTGFRITISWLHQKVARDCRSHSHFCVINLTCSRAFLCLQAAMTKTDADLHSLAQSNPNASFEVGSAFSVTKPVPSSRSREEVSPRTVDSEDGSESRQGKPEGKYKCSVCGALHLKPSLLKQHMSSHSEDVSL